MNKSLMPGVADNRGSLPCTCSFPWTRDEGLFYLLGKTGEVTTVDP